MRNHLRDTAAFMMLAFLSACGGGTGEPQPVDNVVATVTVSGSATIAPGATKQLSAVGRNAAGVAVSGLTAAWTSSNTSTATVNASTGLVTAVANGTTNITATISAKTGQTTITVATITPVAAATVQATATSQFSPSQVDLTVGGTVTWQFDNSIIHNVTFAAGAAGTPSNIGDSQGSNVSRIFATAGTFNYACTIHAGMTGAIIVH